MTSKENQVSGGDTASKLSLFRDRSKIIDVANADDDKVGSNKQS